MRVREVASLTYIIAANGDTIIAAASDGFTSLVGFQATTAGTIAVKNAAGTVTVLAFPVAAGGFYPIPLVDGNGLTVTAAGGATGTLYVSQQA